MREEPKENPLDFSQNPLSKSRLLHGPMSIKSWETGKLDVRCGLINDRFGLIVLKNSA